MVLAEPSVQSPGHVYLVSNPYGSPEPGVHMDADEVRKLRDHLTKLLMEQPIDDAAFVAEEKVTLSPEQQLLIEPPKDLPPVDAEKLQAALQARLRARGEHGSVSLNVIEGRRKRRRLRLPQFRVEFKWGKLEGITAFNTKGDS